MSVRARFVGEVLDAAGDRLLSSQERAVRRSVKLHTGRILSARDIVVSGGAEMDGKLIYTHTAYERFLDMRRLGGQKKSSKRRRIHNRFVFGAYSGIAERLMYGLTEEVSDLIRSRLNNSSE